MSEPSNEVYVSLGSDTRRFWTSKSAPPSFTEFESWIKSRFHLDDAARLRLRFTFHECVLVADSEEDAAPLWEYVAWWPNGRMRRGGMKGGIVEAEVVEHKVEKQEVNTTVDLRIAASDYFVVVTFPSSPPPSLSAVLDTTKSRFDSIRPSDRLFLVDSDGKRTLVENEEQWLEIGWKRAVSGFEKSKKEGG